MGKVLSSLFYSILLLSSAYAKQDCGPVPPGGSFDENCNIVLVPPPHLQKESSQILRLRINGHFETISADRVVLATLTLSPPPENPKGKSKEFVFQNKKLKDFLQQIKFESPEEPGGVPSSMITGKLRLSIKSESMRAVEEREFAIHNDCLLNDLHAPPVYYRTKKPIKYSDYK